MNSESILQPNDLAYPPEKYARDFLLSLLFFTIAPIAIHMLIGLPTSRLVVFYTELGSTLPVGTIFAINALDWSTSNIIVATMLAAPLLAAAYAALGPHPAWRRNYLRALIGGTLLSLSAFAIGMMAPFLGM
jgi:phosphate/sulfate permease